MLLAVYTFLAEIAQRIWLEVMQEKAELVSSVRSTLRQAWVMPENTDRVGAA